MTMWPTHRARDQWRRRDGRRTKRQRALERRTAKREKRAPRPLEPAEGRR